MQNLIQIILEESDKSIENAYNEGYKQAVLEFKPEADYWKEKYQKNNSIQQKIKIGGLCVAAGLLTGFIIGFAAAN